MRKRTIKFDADWSSFTRGAEEAAKKTEETFNKARTSANGGGGGSSGRGGSSSSGFDRSTSGVENNAAEIFRSMVQDAEKLNVSQRERVKYIRDEINALTQAQRIDENRARIQARMDVIKARRLNRNRRISGSQLQEEEDSYREKMGGVQENAQNTSFQERVLRNNLNNYSRNPPPPPEDGENIDAQDSGNKKKRQTGESGASKFLYAMAGGAAGGFGLGAFMQIGSFINKIIHDAEKLQVASGDFAGLRGQQGGRRVAGMGEAASYGLSNADFLSYSKNVGLGMGTANVGDSAINQLAVQKRFGLDEGTLNDLNKVGRIGGIGANGRRAGAEDSTRIVANVVREFSANKIFGFDKGDFGMLGEKLADLSGVMESVGSNIEGGLSSMQGASLLSALGKAGGSFADQRSGATIGKISNAISNPGNDFSKAVMFRAIRSSDTSQSLFDVMKRQEQGATPENVKAVLDLVTKGGKNANTYFNVSQALGIGLGAAENLSNRYLENGDIAEGLSGQAFDIKNPDAGGYDQFAGRTRSLGKRAPGTIQQFSATVENISAGKGAQAIQALKPVMDEALSAVSTAGDILVMTFKGAAVLTKTAEDLIKASNEIIKHPGNPALRYLPNIPGVPGGIGTVFGIYQDIMGDQAPGAIKSTGDKKKAEAKPGDHGMISNELLQDIRNILQETNRINKNNSMRDAYWSNNTGMS